MEARIRRPDVVVRAKDNRALDGEVQRLRPHMHLRPKAGTIV
jgi:hypothetical protein